MWWWSGFRSSSCIVGSLSAFIGDELDGVIMRTAHGSFRRGENTIVDISMYHRAQALTRTLERERKPCGEPVFLVRWFPVDQTPVHLRQITTEL